MKGAWIVTGIVGVVLAAGLLAGCSGESDSGPAAGSAEGQTSEQATEQSQEGHEGHEHPTSKSEGEEAATQEIAQEKCPVMGLPINEDVCVDYKGRRIYFCCDGCDDKFMKNPEKYLAKLDE